MGRSTGSGYDDLDSASGSSLGKFGHFLRCPVGGKRVHFKRNLHFFQIFGGRFHDLQVRSAAHDDAY